MLKPSKRRIKKPSAAVVVSPKAAAYSSVPSTVTVHHDEPVAPSVGRGPAAVDKDVLFVPPPLGGLEGRPSDVEDHIDVEVHEEDSTSEFEPESTSNSSDSNRSVGGNSLVTVSEGNEEGD